MKHTSRILMLLLLGLSLSLLVIPAARGQEVAVPGTAATVPAASGPNPAPPAIAAKAALVVNADDGQILFSQNPDERLPMASTTKMMTALLTIENHRQDMDKMVTCSQRCAEVGESSIWLVAGEQLTVKEMLTGMLIQSGNDSAMALAEYDAGTMEAFVAKMNQRAAELGMTNTHFMNPHGLHDPDHYTSATDLVKLGREVMKHPEIRDIVKQTEATIPWTGQEFGRQLVNHNHLLKQYSAVNGIKTGFTDEAGQCIVISATENGTYLVMAYLGGPSLAERDTDVINLLHYGFANYQQQTVISKDTAYGAVDLPFDYGRKLTLVADSSMVKTVYIQDSVKQNLVLPEKLNLPVHKGDKVGLVEAFEGNKYLGSTYLIATEDVPAPGLRDRITYYLAAVFHTLLSAARLG
ncbi:MAG: D-alanyl-D-alanine carboxypeptidase family protein [Thermoleophilia bacterium]